MCVHVHLYMACTCTFYDVWCCGMWSSKTCGKCCACALNNGRRAKSSFYRFSVSAGCVAASGQACSARRHEEVCGSAALHDKAPNGGRPGRSGWLLLAHSLFIVHCSSFIVLSPGRPAACCGTNNQSSRSSQFGYSPPSLTLVSVSLFQYLSPCLVSVSLSCHRNTT
jgi:hypothetical protein